MRRRDDEGDPPPPRPPTGGPKPPPAPPPPPPPPPPVLTPAQGSSMRPDQYLGAGAELRSPSGRYTFVYQPDGNLVLYKNYPFHDRKWLWDSARFSAPGRCVMQGDGNLVVYNSAGAWVWDSATNGQPGAYLEVQDDGNVVVYRADRHALWATNTVQPPLPASGPPASGAVMWPGQVLHPEKELRAGKFALVFQGDGNLVLYRYYSDGNRKALWGSGTNGRRAEVCTLRGDGNLVIQGPDGEVLWATNTSAPGGRLQLHAHGDLAIHAASDQVVWSTDTPRLEYRRDFGDDGWVAVTIRPSGDVRFHGHQRNGNIIAESVDFRVGAFVKFGARTIAMFESGHLGTKTSPGGSPIDRKWDYTERRDVVRQYYEEIERFGQFNAEQEREGQLSDRLESLVDGAVRWVIGKVFISLPFGGLIVLIAAGASLWQNGSLLPAMRFIEGAFWLAGPDGTLYSFLARGIASAEDDEKRRPHEWEWEFAQQEFKNTLPSKDKVWVTNHKGLDPDREFVFPAFDGTRMNLGPELWGINCKKDFDALSAASKAVWVHELTHVWQIEHTDMTGAWLADAMYSQVCNSLGGEAYEVDWDNLKPWGEYNLEQQGAIVEKWYHDCATIPGQNPDEHPLHRYMVNHIWMGRP